MIQKLQRVFHTDKWWGKVAFIIFAYLVLILIWFNILIPHINDGFKTFLDFNFIPIHYSLTIMFSPIWGFFNNTSVVADPLFYFFSVIPILSFVYVGCFIFKVIKLDILKGKIYFYCLHFLFILLMLRILVFIIINNIQPNFF